MLSPREALPSPRTRIPGSAGIDGVLSDSWSIRRRTSEGLLKPAGRTGDGSESHDNPQATGIKEEEEENKVAGQDDGGAPNGVGQAAQSDPPPENVLAGRGEAQANANSIGAGIGKLTLNTQPGDVNAGDVNAGNPAPHSPVESAPAGPPPGIMDLSTVEWSYLDPQGQVQGTEPSVCHRWQLNLRLLRPVPSCYNAEVV